DYSDIMPELNLGWLAMFGNGGVGKTRLSLELARKLSQKGWLAGFVPGDALDNWFYSPSFNSWSPSANTLMIIDNAARKSEILTKLLVHFATQNPPFKFRVRVILIERRAAVEAGWLGELLSGVEEEHWHSVHRSMDVPLRLGFPGRDNPEGTMVSIVKAAMGGWSKLTGKQPPELPQMNREALSSLRLNTDLNPVFLQLAALKACESGSATNITDWPKGQLLHWAVNRERTFIRAHCPKSSDSILVERAAAIIAFTGARAAADNNFSELIKKDALLMGASENSVENTLAGLSLVAGKTGEGGRTIFVPIAHDLVNGAFGVIVLGEYRDVMEKTLSATINFDPEPVWLSLIRTTGDLSGVDGFATVKDWLDLVLAERPVDELIRVSRYTSMKNSNLAAFGVALHETMVIKLPQSPSYAPVRADTMNRLSVANFELGAINAALEIAKRAVEAYEKLAQENPAYRARLANCLNNMAAFYAISGKPIDAARAETRVVEIRRELLKGEDSGQMRAELAGAWTNLAASFIRAGYYERAMEASANGLDLWEKLARSSPQAFIPGFAQCLLNSSIAHFRLGRLDEATRLCDRATGFFRDLAERNPDAFDSELGAALSNMAGYLGLAGKRQKSLAAAEEAANIYERLSLRNPETFAEDLALSQNNLAAELIRSGQLQRAEKAARKSVEIYAKLMSGMRMRFASPYAVALSNLAIASNKRISPDQALSSAQKSAEIHEQLASVRPDGYADRNAAVKISLARVMSDVGMAQKALPIAAAAIAAYEKLVQEKPGLFELDLACALGQAAEAHRAAGEIDDARNHYRRALDLLKIPMEKNPECAIPVLATLASAYMKICKDTATAPATDILLYYEKVLSFLLKAQKGK
ncbi:tetratricopeptide repeat protein, partial [bacterium]